LGQAIPCQLVVRNTSSAPVHQVVVRLPLGEGMTCKLTEPVAVSEGGVLTWSLGTMQAGQTQRLEMHLVGTTRGALACQAQATFTTTVANMIYIREPMLALKLRVPDKIVAGEAVTVALTASNPGDGPTESIKLRLQLPEGLEHPRGRVVDVELGDLSPKDSRTVQVVCRAKTGGVHKCQASASADNNLSASDAGQIEVLVPRLEVAVAGPQLRYLDRQATYVVKLSNPGTTVANNVNVHEVLPAGFKFQSATSGGRFDQKTRLVSWNVGELLPGQSKEFQFAALAVAVGPQRHAVSASADGGLKTDGELMTKVEGLSALVIEVVDTDDPVEVGADTTYEIRVANDGTKAETNLEVVCSLPDKMEFKNAQCAAGCRFRVEGRDVIFEALPRLAPRADVIYRVQVRAQAAGDVRCRVRVRSDNITEPVLREENTRIYNDESSNK
jgi:uncharacterized repeat protein (TIGR01451 family)